MKLFKEKAGVISETPVWVIIADCWLYIAPTLLGVLKLYITEYGSDKHLVG